jgi:hypothetical protein
MTARGIVKLDAGGLGGAGSGRISGPDDDAARSAFCWLSLPQLISYVVWLYFRFPLSLHMVEKMSAARGISVIYETIRHWGLKFGREFANRIRRRAPRYGDRWHLGEVVITIAARSDGAGARSTRRGWFSMSSFRVEGTRTPPNACSASSSRSRGKRFCFGMWWRRSALALNGMVSSGSEQRTSSHPAAALTPMGLIRATAPLRRVCGRG